MNRHAKIHAAAIGLALALAGGHAWAAQSGVAGFCAAHPDSDFPARAFYGSAYSEAKIPKPVRKAGANAWRCMDGKVLVCRIGADGRPCQKLDAAATPSGQKSAAPARRPPAATTQTSSHPGRSRSRPKPRTTNSGRRENAGS